ncbi:hypothetical protein CJU89_3540 [Yarrowia sp. B02]|nr:hypothetical protein CJU89_3540 [Yarrowia sp. B02]
MLPPELVNILLEHLDLFSLVSLSQTCQSWHEAITEAEYRYMLLKSCPFYQLDNSSRPSWRDCSMEYLRRSHTNSPKVDSSIIQQLAPLSGVTVRTDQLLPPSFHSLCKLTLTHDGWHDEVPLRHYDAGFAFNGAFVSLREDSGGIMTEEYQVDNCTISSRFGMGMRFPDGGRAVRVLTNSQCIASIVCVRPRDYRILVKYDSPGSEPDIDFGATSDDWLYSVGFCPSNLTSFELFLVESCIFVYVQQRGHIGALLALNNGVMERVLFNDKHVLTSSPDMLCVFDGKIAMAGKQVMPDFMRYLFNRTPVHATNISQDPEHSNYVGLYNAIGSMTHLLDFKTQSILDVTAMYYTSLQAGFFALPGLVDGELVVYKYSQQFLEQNFGDLIDVQALLTQINSLVDSPAPILVSQVAQNRLSARARNVHANRHRRVVV